MKDELALKTVLKCLRSLVMFAKECSIDTRHEIATLVPLCNAKEENLDFFLSCLSIKLKERQRSLKSLKAMLDTGDLKDCLKTVEHVVMPIVDYLVFGGAQRFAQNRGTISYGKDQKVNTLDEGLSVYTAYAGQLGWSGYYKLVKKLLYKL